MGLEADGSIEKQQLKMEGNLNQSRRWGSLGGKVSTKTETVSPTDETG
jgi:hypothetical protein